MPSYEMTAGRLIKSVKTDRPCVIMEVANTYFNADQDIDVIVQPPAKWAQSQILQATVDSRRWNLKRKLYGQGDGSKGFKYFSKFVYYKTHYFYWVRGPMRVAYKQIDNDCPK